MSLQTFDVPLEVDDALLDRLDVVGVGLVLGGTLFFKLLDALFAEEDVLLKRLQFLR